VIIINVDVHRHCQDFLSAGALFLTKSNDLFLVITLSYMVICVKYCHQLPFSLICGGAPHQIQPHFCLNSTEMPRNFFVALGVPHGAPAPPGYAYVDV